MNHYKTSFVINHLHTPLTNNSKKAPQFPKPTIGFGPNSWEYGINPFELEKYSIEKEKYDHLVNYYDYRKKKRVPPKNFDIDFPIDPSNNIITTKDIFFSIVEKPIVWRSLHRFGFSINKIKKKLHRISCVEPKFENQKFLLSYDGKKYNIFAFDLLDAVSIPSFDNNYERGLHTVRINFKNSRIVQLQNEIEEFEWIINRPHIGEKEIQIFLEKHQEYLLGLEYKEAHPQVSLIQQDGTSELRPAFFIEKINGNFCDIIDLKLPDKKLLVGSVNRRTFSSHIISALGQLKAYRNYFDDSANRKLFYNTYGFQAYKPKIFVVIGREESFDSPIEKIAIEQELSHLQILTYDDLINRAKRRLDLMKG